MGSWQSTVMTLAGRPPSRPVQHSLERVLDLQEPVRKLLPDKSPYLEVVERLAAGQQNELCCLPNLDGIIPADALLSEA